MRSIYGAVDPALFDLRWKRVRREKNAGSEIFTFMTMFLISDLDTRVNSSVFTMAAMISATCISRLFRRRGEKIKQRTILTPRLRDGKLIVAHPRMELRDLKSLERRAICTILRDCE